jgi:hypothetical protein
VSHSGQTDIYTALREQGISSDRADLLLQWSDRKLFTLFDTLLVAQQSAIVPTDTPFNFVANDSLSGRPVPVASGGKRLQKVTQLARFAALYADTLLVRDPFEAYPRASVARDENGLISPMSRGLEPEDLLTPTFDNISLMTFVSCSFSSRWPLLAYLVSRGLRSTGVQAASALLRMKVNSTVCLPSRTKSLGSGASQR